MACKGSSPLGGNRGNSPLDRSKVRILLCDNDVKSSQEVLGLLCNCSYQVISVRTARQVIAALNAEGPEIDIILAEVDLPIAKGLKMLKYIMRDKELRRIPIIMMSSQDEVSVVVKCLRLGAADYLVKPLRTNELLNLWTHMWRRRRMLGLAEKNILNYDFDLVASDPSDANTNSTTLFSDDTDEKSRKTTLPETSMSNHKGYESYASAAVDPSPKSSSEYRLDALETPEQPGVMFSFPKKSELKVGESSAFFTYIKSSTQPINNSPRHGYVDESIPPSLQLSSEDKLPSVCEQVGDAERYNGTEAWENFSHGDGFVSNENAPVVRTIKKSTIPVQLEYPQECHLSGVQSSITRLHSSNEGQVDFSGVPSFAPFYMSGMMNQMVMLPPAQLYQGSLHDVPKHATSAMLPPQDNALTHFPHVPMMAPFSYYPFNVSLQPGQMPAPHMWPSMARSSSTEVKSGRVERREAALIKFRQKRKDRCFDKKIRYVNRKRLAERRPRVRGQFVRQMNGADADLNGRSAVVDDSDEDEEDEEDASEY
ncbi:CCT motif -containing response regulator protein [Tasmannia lanceolata]|uniref:CCT motif -containing response regulator protein n=1 Tax=Tasmannia lanceolata TaxID=3420 RepID=UPI0040637E48